MILFFYGIYKHVVCLALIQLVIYIFSKDMITALLDDHRKERFGNIESDFNSECSDPSNAPSYMLGDDDDQFDSLPFPPSSQHDNVSTAGSNPPEVSSTTMSLLLFFFHLL